MDLPEPTREISDLIGDLAASVRDDEPSTFPDGSLAVVCTSWARQIRLALGDRVEIFGFFCSDNSAPEMGRLSDGHDFAVLDGRYVIDPWLTEIESELSSPMIDLADPENAEVVRGFYGDPDLWVRDDDPAPSPTG